MAFPHDERAAPASEAQSDWSLSVVAFGEPSDPRTFSGLARSISSALDSQGRLRQRHSAKNVHPLDALSGAVCLMRGRRGLPRLAISRGWMWSWRGSATLSSRLAEAIRARGDSGAFLEIGTLIEIPEELGPQCVLTDMTISQARRAGQFTISKLSRRQLDEAEQVQRRRLERAAHIFAFSDWTAQGIMEEFDIPPERVTVTYAGPNLQLPEDREATRREREILFVGIDWERKGGPLLIEAFRSVRRALPDARLVVVGCEPQAREDGVEWLGYLDKRSPADAARLARAYSQATCFCLPSSFDPFPNAIIEAASAGLPSVSIDVGSRREAIRHGETGLLVERSDPRLLADALIELLSDSGRAGEWGRRARDDASERFTWPAFVARLEQGLVKAGQVPVGSTT